MPSLIRVFSHAVKGSLRLQNRSNLRFTEKSRCELCVKAEKRNFGDFEALDRLKISALLEDPGSAFFSYFGFLSVFVFIKNGILHASAFLQTQKRNVHRESQNEGYGRTKAG